MRILVADDSLSMRGIIKGMLTKAGFKDIIEAANGREVINRVNEMKEQLDVILLDINMPQLDGLTVLRVIKHAKTTHHIPVIMVTSDSNKETVIESLKHGAAGYLVKPFSWKALEEKVQEVVNKPQQLL